MFSRILGQSSVFAGGRSIYETLRQYDDEEDEIENADDVEALAGMMTAGYDEELEGPNDYELSPPADLTKGNRTRSSGSNNSKSRYRDTQYSHTHLATTPVLELEPDEVPPSLLIERPIKNMDVQNSPLETVPKIRERSVLSPQKIQPQSSGGRNIRLEEPRSRNKRDQPISDSPGVARIGTIDPKARAMWRWANIENLDNFLHDVGAQLSSRKTRCLLAGIRYTSTMWETVSTA